MCTVTILPRSTLAAHAVGLDAPLLRLVCNRDEQRARPAALPPALRWIAGRRVAMPVDPVGGGSWIAVNESGVVCALLNANGNRTGDTQLRAGQPSWLSRGLIIPAVASSDSVSDALERALGLDVASYLPFRLLLLDPYQLVECWPESGQLRYRRSFLGFPAMRTSSGLGDALVLGPRRTLFRRFLSGARDPLAAQDAFHGHQWSGREDISVLMERADARTVSRSVVCVGTGMASLTYRAVDEPDEHRLSFGVHADHVRSAMCS